MSESTIRIVVLGKTGAGKSSLANTMFEEKMFKIDYTAKSGTKECKAETKSINGRSITLIDTPGLFDTDRAEEEMKREIVSCITECAPGPHVFLIVLKVEKYTKHEKEVIQKMDQYFSEEASKYAILLFTHGDQLPEGTTIENFVCESEDLSDLVKKCGGRCHVIDNRYWQSNQQHEYRSNQFQVEELLKTIDMMVVENKGGCYTNEMLQAVESKIQQEEVHIKQSSANISPEEILHKAKASVRKQLLKAAGVTTGALLGAFLGGAMKIMNEGPIVPLTIGVAIGTAAGIAAGIDATAGKGATAEAPTPSTAEEHRE